MNKLFLAALAAFTLPSVAHAQTATDTPPKMECCKSMKEGGRCCDKMKKGEPSGHQDHDGAGSKQDKAPTHNH